jgi:Tol biopolymer transport system component
MVALVVAMAGGASASPGATERVSVDSAGNQGNGDSLWYLAISDDGRYVSFESQASNLVPGDTNTCGYYSAPGTCPDIFVHDRQTGETTRVSVDSEGGQANGASENLAMSGDGRYVSLESQASNLIPGDTNSDWDIFVHDRQTAETSRVSIDNGNREGNGGSRNPSISADGRFVAFESRSSNLVTGDTNDASDIFMRDRQTGETTRVSVASGGNQANNGSGWPSISADGRYVAFWSDASNLVPNDTNGKRDIFVHDCQTAETTRVSVDTTASQGNSDSYHPAISADGRYITFSSESSNLVLVDANNRPDVFIHDRQTRETTMVSVGSAGNQGNDDSWWSSLSADGRFVAFHSQASNLVGGDGNNCRDVFVHDRHTGQTKRVSISNTGAEGNGNSLYNAISADGQIVAFSSQSSNLVVGDTNGCQDVFVRELGLWEPTPSPTATRTPTPTKTPTPSNTPTPTATPTPPPGVGGTVKLPPAALAAESGVPREGSGGAASGVALAGAVVGGVVVLAAGGWYARRRRRAR